MKTSTLVVAGIVAAVAGLIYYEKTAAASSPALAQPGTVTVNLQPGGTTVAVAKGGTVTLVLPQGASWATTNAISPVQAGSVAPSAGNPAYSLVMSTVAGVTPITASWVDSTGTAQTTTVNISVS
jgi:hypothetical protein